ncbi:Uncharacterised protein [Vibrio cholerae]|nr:Uncharacterised protein [Vibrio cholerae]
MPAFGNKTTFRRSSIAIWMRFASSIKGKHCVTTRVHLESPAPICVSRIAWY